MDREPSASADDGIELIFLQKWDDTRIVPELRHVERVGRVVDDDEPVVDDLAPLRMRVRPRRIFFA